MRRLALFVILLFATSLASSAAARRSRAIDLETDVVAADAVFIGTVVSERVLAASQPGPAGSTVKVVELKVHVGIPFQNAKTGGDVKIRHLVVLPSSQPGANGFDPVELAKGKAYLFFLQRSSASPDQLELRAIEDSASLVELDPAALPALAAVAKRAKRPLDKAVDVLIHILERCKGSCPGAIWLLADVAALRPHAPPSPRAKRFTKALSRVVERSNDYNTLLAAYTELGRRGVKSFIGRVVKLACKPNRGKKAHDVVSFLQGLSADQEIKALDSILACAKDADVVESARYRRDHLVKMP